MMANQERNKVWTWCDKRSLNWEGYIRRTLAALWHPFSLPRATAFFLTLKNPHLLCLFAASILHKQIYLSCHPLPCLRVKSPLVAVLSTSLSSTLSSSNNSNSNSSRPSSSSSSTRLLTALLSLQGPILTWRDHRSLCQAQVQSRLPLRFKQHSLRHKSLRKRTPNLRP